MLDLAATVDITSIKTLIDQWVLVGQALVGSIGALAFVFAFPYVRLTRPKPFLAAAAP